MGELCAGGEGDYGALFSEQVPTAVLGVTVLVDRVRPPSARCSVLSPTSPSSLASPVAADYAADGEVESSMGVLESFQPPVETADSVLEYLSVDDLPRIQAGIDASKAVGGDIQLVDLGEQCIARLRAGLALEAAISQLYEKRWV